MAANLTKQSGATQQSSASACSFVRLILSAFVPFFVCGFVNLTKSAVLSGWGMLRDWSLAMHPTVSPFALTPNT